MARIVSLLLIAGLLAACQTPATSEPPYIPPGASQAQQRQILCGLPPSSPYYVPCSDGLR